MERIVGYCGVVCSDCDVYKATINNDQELRLELARKYTNDEHVANPEDFFCEGCFRIKGEGCEIRQCAVTKGDSTCADCKSYACDILNQHFNNSPESKSVLEDIRKNK